MSCCQYLLLAVIALVLACNTVAGDGYIKQPPLACTHNGKQYPLYGKWSSTVAGECMEYTCQDTNKLHSVTCMTPMIAEDPNKTCYEINVPNSSYPYCCTRYHCVDKNKKNKRH